MQKIVCVWQVQAGDGGDATKAEKRIPKSLIAREIGYARERDWEMIPLTLVASCKTESGDRPDNSKDVVRQDRVHLALSWVGLKEGQTRARRRDNLLFFRSGKLTKQRL